MKKSIKLFFIFLLTAIILLSSISYPVKSLSDVNIIQDSDRTNSLPSHFRKTTDISKATALKSINTKGLDKLNISGSGQFTISNLPLLIENIDSNLSIIVVDLREESHGFINNTAISFSNLNNNANFGLSLEEVIKKENQDLSSIKLNEPLTLHNNNITITPNIVTNERTVAESNNISYLRIPVTDGNLPNDDMVDYFIKFVKNQPESYWEKQIRGASRKKIDARIAEIRESLCAVNMVSLAEAMVYQELGEPEAARQSLLHYGNYIKKAYLSSKGFVQRLDMLDPSPENYWSKTLPEIQKNICTLPCYEVQLLEAENNGDKM